jgi:hypothetical protein
VEAAQVGGNLADYLKALSSSTNVQQEVKSPFGERALLGLNINVTLGEAQHAIARNYELTWRATGAPPQYLLFESSRERERRVNLLRLEQAAARKRMLARWDEVRRLAFMDRADLDRAAAAGERMATAFKHPRGAAMARLLFQLPDSVIQQVLTSGSARVSISALSPELQGLARSAARQGVADPDLITREGYIDLKLGGTIDRPTIITNPQYGRDGFYFNPLYSELVARQRPEDRRKAAGARPLRAPKDPRFTRRVPLRDHALATAVEPGERPPRAKPLAVLLKELVAQVQLPVLAECEYVPPEKDRNSAWLQAQWWLGGEIVEQPLTHAPDLLCADFEYEWSFRDGFLLLRPKLWFVEPEQRKFVFPKFL